MVKMVKMALMLPTDAEVDDFCTTSDAAKLLDVCVKTIQLWAESGILQSWKTPGGHRRITRKSVQELITQRQSALSPRSEQAAATPVTRQVLVVEDDKHARRLYELTVSHWGLPMQITIARDGFDALLKIGERQPDILITDLTMPGMDGFRLVAALRGDERYKAIHIVVVSGMSSSEIQKSGLPEDVAVLAKPIPFNDLRAIIEKHLVN